MKKLVVFDWNGTLYGDFPACFAADNWVITQCRGKPVNKKVYMNTIIIPAIDFYTQHDINVKYFLKHRKKLSSGFHRLYEELAAQMKTRKGARELLVYLKEKQVEVIILSNHIVDKIEMQLERLGLSEFIDKVLANTSFETSMDHQNKLRKLRYYMKKKGYVAKDVVFVGDSPEEVQVSQKIGCVSVAITGGYYSTKRLRAAQPDYLISSLRELRKIVK